MEILYRIKKDYQENGDNSEIMHCFQYAYESLCKKKSSKGIIEQKLELLKIEIKQLDEHYRKVCRELETELNSARLYLDGNGIDIRMMIC